MHAVVRRSHESAQPIVLQRNGVRDYCSEGCGVPRTSDELRLPTDVKSVGSRQTFSPFGDLSEVRRARRATPPRTLTDRLCGASRAERIQKGRSDVIRIVRSHPT